MSQTFTEAGRAIHSRKLNTVDITKLLKVFRYKNNNTQDVCKRFYVKPLRYLSGLTTQKTYKRGSTKMKNELTNARPYL